MYKRALVTGGAGFIGSHLSERLAKEKVEVVIIDNLSTGRISNIPSGTEFVKGDILDFNLLQSIFKDKIDIVFHLAALVSIRSSIKSFYKDVENNLIGTVNLLQAMQSSKVKKIVFASSMAVYADSPNPAPINESYRTEPISPYGISKLASEKYIINICNNIGVKPIILRYFNTYGTRQTLTPYVGVITIFINRLLRKKPPVIFGDGKQIRDFVSVEDIVNANIKAMYSEISGEIFNIGSGKGTSVNEIAELLCGKINPKIKPENGPCQQGELIYSIANINKAKNLLGYEPMSNLNNDIDRVIEYIISQPKTEEIAV